MSKYFGTDGFRGEANVGLTVEHAYRIGRFLGWYYGREHKCSVVIGKDTRRSSYMFENALSAGLTASGADAYLMHVTTTPSVSYIVRSDDFDCGIMISASHNPFTDNGIKLLNSAGEKMEQSVIDEIENYLDGNLEIPKGKVLPEYEAGSGTQWTVGWYGLTAKGKSGLKCSTYHCFDEGWYLELPESWDDAISVREKSETDGTCTIHSVGFYQKSSGRKAGAEIVTIYALYGAARQEQVEARGLTSALISVGGNLRAIGTKPDGSQWVGGVENPWNSSEVYTNGSSTVAAVKMSDLSLVTSGDYQRYYVVDGVRYHHLIDPATLWPAAYFDGVSVLAPDSGVADCLTTGLFCLPLEEGKQLVESLDGVEALWCTTDGEVVTSSGWSEHTN